MQDEIAENQVFDNPMVQILQRLLQFHSLNLKRDHAENTENTENMQRTHVENMQRTHVCHILGCRTKLGPVDMQTTLPHYLKPDVEAIQLTCSPTL
jgi:hypothetical protein